MKRLTIALPGLGPDIRSLVQDYGRSLGANAHGGPGSFAFLFFLKLQIRKAPDVPFLKRSNAGLIGGKAACNPFCGGKNFSALQHVTISLIYG
jgi:hypothetical protein